MELAALMRWPRSTAMGMSMRYGHLLAAGENQLSDAVEHVHRTARRLGDGLASSLTTVPDSGPQEPTWR